MDEASSTAAPVSPQEECTLWKLIVCFGKERHYAGKVLIRTHPAEVETKHSTSEISNRDFGSKTVSRLRHLIKPSSLTSSYQVPNGPRDFLEDTDGSKRGAYIYFDDDEHLILDALMGAYTAHENKLACVQKYTPHLLHHMVIRPGFPNARGADIGSARTGEMEVFLSLRMKKALSEIGYCSPIQDIEWYLSFLKTEQTQVQPPHIDFHWKDMSQSRFQKLSRSAKMLYNEWLPFIAVCPLTRDGMTIEVWNARSEHDQPECVEDETGIIVHVPYGTILLLRWDVVHAGGFATAQSGNPRCHFYIYKKPCGALHAYPSSNCYHVDIGRRQVPLLDYYRHCSLSAATSIVKYQQQKTRNGRI